MVQSWLAGAVAALHAFSLVMVVVMCHGSATSNQEVAGKAEYELITRDSKMPVYGDCWKRALDDLDRGCKVCLCSQLLSMEFSIGALHQLSHFY